MCLSASVLSPSPPFCVYPFRLQRLPVSEERDTADGLCKFFVVPVEPIIIILSSSCQQVKERKLLKADTDD